VNVRAIFHRMSEPSLQEWRTRLSQPPGGDPALALFMREELIRKLEQSEGFPDGANYRSDLSPPGWVWEFAAGAWIQFVVRDDKGFLGFGQKRIVYILRITPENPA
jgi:hypothetical protein